MCLQFPFTHLFHACDSHDDDHHHKSSQRNHDPRIYIEHQTPPRSSLVPYMPSGPGMLLGPPPLGGLGKLEPVGGGTDVEPLLTRRWSRIKPITISSTGQNLEMCSKT